jgi:alpha-glucosidase
MWPTAPASTAGHHPEAVELHVFMPGEDGTWTSFLQEDDGVTTAAAQGARVRTTFTITRTGERVALRADVEGDGYPEFARQRFVVVVHDATERREPVEVTNAGSGFALDLA